MRVLKSGISQVSAILIGLACLAFPGQASALDANQAYSTAFSQINTATADLPAIEAAVRGQASLERSAAQRIADAVLLLGNKDYERAANILNAVIEKYPNDQAAYADALALLGETYFNSKQYLSARRAYKQIVSRASEPRFTQYQIGALTKLVDIVLRIKDYNELDAIFALMAQAAPGPLTSTLNYARGKGLVAKRDYAGAKAALSAIDPSSEYLHQSKYLLGVIAMKEATPPPEPKKAASPAEAADQAPPVVPVQRYTAAIEQFRRVTELAPDTAAHRHVIDLAWLAIGRLFYETDQWNQALLAYNRIGRDSPEFGTMLYELGWVYVRLGDFERAQRALEVLAIADPNSQNIADGLLLRGDLMLRAGQFDKSLKVYEGVRSTYDPMRERVDAFLGSTSDPAVYYDKLSQADLTALDSASLLPALAVQWAREAEDGPLAFAVIDDVNQCREMIKQSNELIEKLNGVLNSPARVRAFAELKAGEEKALSVLNRIGLARLSIGQGMDDAEPGDLTGEIGAVRARRRAMEKRLSAVPVTESDFQGRENQARKQWSSASQALQRLTLQVDSSQATVNGLRRMIKDNPGAQMRFQQDIVQSERELAFYREQVESLRKYVQAAKNQAGFGDQRFVEDEQVRRAYREAVGREAVLALAGAGGARLKSFVERVSPLLSRAEETDRAAENMLYRIQQEVERRTIEVQRILSEETANMATYSARLSALDQEARHLVGEVAMRNFGLVRERIKNIVLRADTGITEEAWEVREEQMMRVRMLQVERSREEKTLKEELIEVLDDSGESDEEAAGKANPKAAPPTVPPSASPAPSTPSTPAAPPQAPPGPAKQEGSP